MRSPNGASGGDDISGNTKRGELAGEEAARPRARKSAEAFRTISEVADELNVPQHVLRFWETKFPRIKPLKRGGGRRYYRPEDVSLLRSIANFLYTQGYTIKGVQRLLKESGSNLADDGPPVARQGAAEPDDKAVVALPAPVSFTAPPPATRPAQALNRVPPLADPAEVSANAETERLRVILIETLRSLEALRDRLD